VQDFLGKGATCQRGTVVDRSILVQGLTAAQGLDLAPPIQVGSRTQQPEGIRRRYLIQPRSSRRHDRPGGLYYLARSTGRHTWFHPVPSGWWVATSLLCDRRAAMHAREIIEDLAALGTGSTAQVLVGMLEDPGSSTIVRRRITRCDQSGFREACHERSWHSIARYLGSSAASIMSSCRNHCPEISTRGLCESLRRIALCSSPTRARPVGAVTGGVTCSVGARTMTASSRGNAVTGNPTSLEAFRPHFRPLSRSARWRMHADPLLACVCDWVPRAAAASLVNAF